MKKLTEPILLASGHRGIYIPKYLAEQIEQESQNWNYEEIKDMTVGLKDIDNEFYWEAYDALVAFAVYTCPTTKKEFWLYQQDDLWLVPAYESSQFDDIDDYFRALEEQDTTQKQN